MKFMAQKKQESKDKQEALERQQEELRRRRLEQQAEEADADRKLVWALVLVLCPCWIHCGFPSTFWQRRYSKKHMNEKDSLESLLYITFSRQLVYYQASRWRHSSIVSPQESVVWDLDIVHDMIRASKMSYVDIDLCAWGAKDQCSGMFYKKTFKFACTFDMSSLMRRCQEDHRHHNMKNKSRVWRSAFRQLPLQLCDAWASLASRCI